MSDLASLEFLTERLGKLMIRAFGKKVKVSEPIQLTDCPGYHVTPISAHDDSTVLLHLHGGGYALGDTAYTVGSASLLSSTLNRQLFCVNYRLSSTAPFPAALDDTLDAYKYLLKTYPAEKIAFIGESAGGGLCYALALKLKEEKLPQPKFMLALSPWVDLTLTAESCTLRCGDTLEYDELQLYAKMYAKETALDTPLLSPLFGDLHMLPPSFIIAGGAERLMDDSSSICKKLRECGCDCMLHIEPDMHHVYPFYRLPKSNEAMKLLNEYINERFFEA